MKFVIIGAGLTGSVIARKRATKLFVCLPAPERVPLVGRAGDPNAEYCIIAKFGLLRCL